MSPSTLLHIDLDSKAHRYLYHRSGNYDRRCWVQGTLSDCLLLCLIDACWYIKEHAVMVIRIGAFS